MSLTLFLKITMYCPGIAVPACATEKLGVLRGAEGTETSLHAATAAASRPTANLFTGTPSGIGLDYGELDQTR